jgi:Arc/MetJ-type ribon-helix-helix transcriptional regulator
MYDLCMNQTINISVPKAMMDDIKDMVSAGHFASVSEVFRAGINKIKVDLHPKYYKEIQISERAKRRLHRAMNDVKKGKYMTITSFRDLLD